MELRDDDAFWAARRVAAFTDEMIRAAVHTGQFSDPAAEKYLGDVLIKRRDKIKSVYLTAVNPIVSPRLDASGRLTFENAAFAAGVASGPATYRAVMVALRQRDGRDASRFQRRRARRRPSRLPTRLADGVRQLRRGGHLGGQRRPIRRGSGRSAPTSAERGEGWTLVGLERLPESLSADPAVQKATR